MEIESRAPSGSSACADGEGGAYGDPGKEAKRGEDIDYDVQSEDEKLQMKVGL